ncbi:MULTISPECIES: hypothetical protein [Streptosporangium]|uniref:Transport-associated OB type 2 domain-containing protein n=1 Tax=Streptosporangium brasiliense TaxID=47480 RepID=A0ABT9R098_9ACTN|nr:hypothetical protein [Streptosporangium brasiliense]MDP9862651.1 hypothetical protein [Streptosporangium brasiliense]
MEVLQVLDPSRGTVSFRCESGAASGRWMGESSAKMGQFDVEIEVPEEITEWTEVPSGVTSLSENLDVETAVFITGEVVRFDDGDDSVVEIRVGSDILLIEIPNRRSELPSEGLISFRAPEIQLYPYDL